MTTVSDNQSHLTDREARCVIVAAEARGFEREPELYGRIYDAELHRDAAEAAEHLRSEDPGALEAALTAPDPVPTWAAVERLMDEGRMSLADVQRVIEVAAAHGYAADAPQPGPVVSPIAEWEAARGPLALLWEDHFGALEEILEGQAQLAPLPETAIDRVDVVPHRFAGPIPDEPEEATYPWRF